MRTLVLALFASFSFSAMALDCGGTEPFWGAKVTDKSITYSDITTAKKVFVVTKTEAPVGVSIDHQAVYSDNRGPLAVVSHGECSDGMSDAVYSKSILLFLDSAVLSGCCE